MCFSCARVWNVPAGLCVLLSATSGFQYHPHPVPVAAPQTVLLPPVAAEEGHFLTHSVYRKMIILKLTMKGALACLYAFIGQTLDQSELQGDGIALSLEEQLCALSLSESSNSDAKATVSLNGSRFRAEIFEESRESTKVSCCVCFFYLFYFFFNINCINM